MDQLFGDATTAMPTPQQEAEVEALMSASRSPVPSLDIRQPGNFTADNAIPGLNINPPHGGPDDEEGRARALVAGSRAWSIGPRAAATTATRERTGRWTKTTRDAWQ